jgi:hypothetical protein
MKVSDPSRSAEHAFVFRHGKLLEQGLPAADADRLTLRTMLKASCLPDRVVTASDGTHGLEVFEHGAWRALPLP